MAAQLVQGRSQENRADHQVRTTNNLTRKLRQGQEYKGKDNEYEWKQRAFQVRLGAGA